MPTNGNTPPPTSGATALRGERRVVTALFCDVANSTALAERFDPEDWTEIISEAFARLTDAIRRYDGTVARLMGDGILAFFGAPTAHEDDPQRAILAALAMMEAVRLYGAELKARHDIDFTVRIGINTGPAVVAEVGAPQAAEQTALGDAVNVAARMEQTATPGTIQCSDDTHQLVGRLFDCEPLGPVEVKGKSAPIAAWRVLRANANPGRLRGIEGVSAPMIGRDREWAVLTDAMVDVMQGRGRIVCLIGEAGLGKSRLIAELQEHWMAQGGDAAHWLQMQGVPYDSSRPFGLFQNFARTMFGVESDDPKEVIHQKVSDGIRAKGGTEDDVALCSVGFERVINARSVNPGDEFTTEEVRRDIYDVLYPAFRQKCQANPLVIVAEDLHWADTASVDLIQHLMGLLDEGSLLIIATSRPERQGPGWKLKVHAETEFPHRYAELHLKPLAPADTDRLVSALLDIADLPAELRAMILRKADGNPYFVEEIVRTLIEDGVVYRTDDGLHWRADTAVADIAIPDSLQGLLVARMDRLDEETRATLQRAAVIGRSFYYRILQAISDATIAIDRHLASLERVELLRESRRNPELEYMFRHELARDAAYGTILNRRRREFHRLVAEAIETLFADRLAEKAHLLAQHFALAGDQEKALRYHEMAAETAAGLHAGAEGLNHYDQAIAAAQELGALADVTRLQGARSALAAATMAA
ncbi:MAG: AAA family ATPase [Bauldia sp.]|nr:AAA family ATPase [Bauldia sp.]